jgi:hypothetical protein
MRNKNQTPSARSLRHLLIPGALIVGIATWGCGPHDKTPVSTNDPTTSGGGSVGGSTGKTISADVPADSSGAMGTTSLNFALNSSSAALALATATTMDIGGGIVLTDARVNIGAIKLKANKDRTPEEKALRRQQKADIKDTETKMEDDKKALEKSKASLESTYQTDKEAATTDTARAAAKTKLGTGLAALSQKEADLHAAKEAAEADKEAAADGNLRWKGPFIYDLIAGSITPQMTSVVVPDGSYKRIEFKLRQNRTAAAGDALLNESVYLAGTVTIKSVATPFSVSLDSDEQVMLNTADAFKVDSTIANSLVVGFNPSNWFTGVDLSAATKETDGSIVLSSKSNPSLLEGIKNNIKSQTKFGKDKDGDGKLSDSEVKGDGKTGVAAVAADDAA